jgi:imidazolonepropionase-like amidohydrolase
MFDAASAGCDTLEHLVDIDDRTIEIILERNITLVPTLSLFSERALSRRSRHQKPKVIDQLRRMGEHAINAFQRCLKAGVCIAAGSDLYRTLLPGENALEVVLMVEYGMSEMQAIVAATKQSAEAVDLADELGTLTPGKWADLILVEGDPLRDIHLLEDKSKIRMVMKAGQIKVDRRSDEA